MTRAVGISKLMIMNIQIAMVLDILIITFYLVFLFFLLYSLRKRMRLLPAILAAVPLLLGRGR